MRERRRSLRINQIERIVAAKLKHPHEDEEDKEDKKVRAHDPPQHTAHQQRKPPHVLIQDKKHRRED
jgi:hypothetical protein